MKQICFFLTLFICQISYLQANERIITHPDFEAWNSSTLEIKEVILNDTSTIIHFEAYYRPEWSIKISSDAYLHADEEYYTIVDCKENELDEEIAVPPSGHLSFHLIFPALPHDTKTFDFIESYETEAVSIWGVRLDNENITSPIINQNYSQENIILEIPKYNPGTAFFEGKVEGFYPDMELDGHIWVYNLFTAEAEEYPLTLDIEGNFLVAIPLLHTTTVNVASGFMNNTIVLTPGKTTTVTVNLPEICRKQSRIRKNNPSLGKSYYFTGEMASLNNEICNNPINLSVLPANEKENQQMLINISKMNPDQYKKYWLERYQKAIKELEQYPNISDSYRKLLIQHLQKETAEQLLQPFNIESAFRHVNKIQEKAIASENTLVPSLTKDYYDFLPLLVPNTAFVLYDSSYILLLQSISEIILSGVLLSDANELPDNTADLAEIMGTDKGFLFDILSVQRLTASMKGLRPLNDKQLAEVNSLSPTFKSVLTDMNNRVIKTIEENKDKSDLAIDQSIIAEIPKEELFKAITSPYRGKVVFISFWETWCSPFKEALQEMQSLKKEMKEKDIVFLYLASENSSESDWEEMIMDIEGEHYLVTLEQFNYWNKKYGVRGVPSYMILSSNGTPSYFQVGFMGAEKARKLLMNEVKE